MAALRYGGVFFSENGTSYIAGIWDDEYVGSTGTWTVQDVEISYQSEDKSRFAPIIGSTARVRIIVDSSAIETLIDDIVGAREGRFSIRILYGVALYWIGYVLPDLITVENSKTQINYTFEINATDALARLKTIDYNNAGTAYTGYETITQHVFNCLNKLTGLTGLYTGGFLNEYILKVVNDWTEDDWTYSATRAVFDETRVHHRAFYSKDAKGNFKYISCYEALERICEAWGMRMLFSYGSFWMIQVNEYANASAWVIHRYETDQTLSTDSSEDVRVTLSQSTPNSTDIVELTGGVYKFLPALDKVKVRYNHIATINLLGGEIWTDSSTPTVTYEDIASNSGLGKLAFQGTLNFSLTWSGGSAQYPYLLFRFTIIVGTQYLNRTATFDGAGGYSYDYVNGQWQALSGTFDYVATYYTEEGGNATQGINFVTDPILADGDLSFTLAFIGPYDRGTGNLVAGSIPDWELSNNYLELLALGTFSGQNDIIEYSAVNDASGNSQVEELLTWMGDGPTITSPGHLEVTDGTAWAPSDNWGIGASGTNNFSQLLANERVRGQLTPVRRKLCTFYNVDDELHPHAAINDTDNSKTYVLVNGTWALGRDEIAGEWFELSLDTSYSENASVQQPSDSPGVDTPSVTGAGSGVTTIIQNSGNVTKVYTEEFTGSATDTFTITVNSGTLPTNTAAILVYLNGQWTNQYTISGSDIVLDFSVESTDYVNVIFFIT